MKKIKKFRAFEGEYTSDLSLIAAAVTITCLPIISINFVLHRNFIEEITSAVVKG